MTFVSPRQGYFAARKGYEAECRENGRVPNWAYFDKMMLGLLGGAEPAVEVPVVPEEPLYDAPWPTDAEAPLDPVQDDPAAAEASRLADAIAETKRRMAEDF